jgi:hypothetical protein
MGDLVKLTMGKTTCTIVGYISPPGTPRTYVEYTDRSPPVIKSPAAPVNAVTSWKSDGFILGGTTSPVEGRLTYTVGGLIIIINPDGTVSSISPLQYA